MFDKALSDQIPGSAAPAVPLEPNTSAINAAVIFGANFKRVREALGFSRDQVATRLGLAPNQIAQIEAGVEGKADLDLIVLMAKQLQISHDDLLEGIS